MRQEPHASRFFRDSPEELSSTKIANEAVLLIIACCLLLSGCRPRPTEAAPSIEFTTLPPAAEGGANKQEMIAGRVAGFRPGQRIVLFARSGPWWVQPFADEPFTVIQSDATWRSQTHLGTEYAALLVEPGYRPPSVTDVLPAVGETVVAVATRKGRQSASSASKIIQFGGYEWAVRSATSDRGGRMNVFDPANVWTDESGSLRLRIARRSGQWACAEVRLTRSLGFGSYVFAVRQTSHLEPSVVLSMFTWDDLMDDPNHREMGVEITRWGDPNSKNAQYVVQPFYVPTNVARFTAPSGALTHSFRWEPGRAAFKTVRGAGGQSPVVAEHVFTSGVPAPGGETIHLSFYIFGDAESPLQDEVEVVIEKFEYLP